MPNFSAKWGLMEQLQAVAAGTWTGIPLYELYTWGDNQVGQLGDGTVASRSSPVQIGTLKNWLQVSAGGYFTSAVKTDGTLWAWGQNASGQLGQGSTISRSSPVQVGALTSWYLVSAGRDHVCATRVDGTLWAWGRNSNAGQLGDGTTVDKNSPVQIGALTNWNQVAAGGYQTFSVKTDGTLWAWGSNTNGVLGQNNLVSRSSPVQVGALTNWSAVGTNFLNSANVFVTAVKTDGTLWAWGKNNLGQLGDGTVIDRSSPIQVGALTNWYQSSESGRATLAIKTDGTLWSWGGSANGTLGGGGYRSSPVQVGSEVNWLFVSGGQNHVAALQGDKTLWTWGSNSNGVLGRTGTAGVPGQVGSLTWTAVSAGTSATAAVN